jgi:dynein heavy chain
VADWVAKMGEEKIPLQEGLDAVRLLVSGESEIAKWNNEGLPTDSISVQNAAIFTTCVRWPLMIDPQLQGLNWIKQRYGADLKVDSHTAVTSRPLLTTVRRSSG